MGYTAEDLLNEREKRVILQQNIMLVHKKPLVFIRVNYPGLNKTNPLTEKILKAIDKCVSDVFGNKIRLKIYRITSEGPNITMVIDMEAMEIKKLTIEIEDKNSLGRCVDIDVYNPNTFMSISRTSLGYAPRKCYICNDIAQNCIRNKKHTISSVIEYINKSYKEVKEI
ncbi:holo-ACP synthase [Clostridium amylolyticum]|uniref:citrate lyase holo-[acyl-carrier protein] synthase n=1 Tax=Clostridium amylolyticum TaxID=1121298 RepID=A0A1M6JPF2_9CLOT|nr:citrate lyase holo-[acyl-carrier protein] synthase [Clostridium amylolyticum]SHJ48544.1 holo-ACP synthase [Clostridium amylolyticum]